MSKMRMVALLSVSAMLSACVDKAIVNSAPSGAKVYWGNRLVGTTPTELRIGRYEDWPTTPGRVEADGYEPFEFEIKSRVPTSRIMCYIFTAAICLIFKRPTFFSQNQYQFNLKALPEGEAFAPTGEPVPTGDLNERLRRLQSLYDEDLIDDREYKQQRAKILRGL